MGAPVPGSSRGLPGVAMMSGAELERPDCHTVPMPMYAAAMTRRTSARGLRLRMNGTKSAEPTSPNAQLR